MELILLFALFAANNDPKLAEKLTSFLAFYRENRDLIALLAKNDAPMPAEKQEKCAETKESRPQREVGCETVLEEYLARLG